MIKRPEDSDLNTSCAQVAIDVDGRAARVRHNVNVLIPKHIWTSHASRLRSWFKFELASPEPYNNYNPLAASPSLKTGLPTMTEASLRAQLNQLKSDNQGLRTEVESIKQERDRFRTEMAKMRSDYAVLQARSDQLECEVGDLRRKVGRSREFVASVDRDQLKASKVCQLNIFELLFVMLYI